MKKFIYVLIIFLLCTLLLPLVVRAEGNDSEGSNGDEDTMLMYKNSDFVEKEQPALNDETKKLISLYQNNPSTENYLNLRDIVIENYNAVLAKKESKLSELIEETSGKPGADEKVEEMEEIVQEMYINYWNRINCTMLRFTDHRLLKWSISDAYLYDFTPVMGAGETIYIKKTPVTNKEYAEFINNTGYQVPKNWINNTYSDGEDDYPVNDVSYNDAKAYCNWLSSKDTNNTYRLPTESEWELAAGHMPKDADFNCGIQDGRTSVFTYADVTHGAHGAIDFWGNVWEWTSTEKSESTNEVKGGSYKSDRTDCRTEYRNESRDINIGYDDVGFRVIQVLNHEEPVEQIEISTLDKPNVTITTSSNEITLSFDSVKDAVAYQIFTYDTDTNLVEMLDVTTDTTYTIGNLEKGLTYSYIVQPISYTSVCDNVSKDNSISITCGEEINNSASEPSSQHISIMIPVTVIGLTIIGIIYIITNLSKTKH